MTTYGMPAMPRHDNTAPGQDELEGVRVLVVEDDDVIRETTTLGLERYGVIVESAPDGLAGWTAFRQSAPDVLLLDVMMPFLDGISLARRVREVGDTPIIMLSARADGLDIVQGLEAGADDYVTKPFDFMVLIARIRAVLRRVRPQQEAAPIHDVTVIDGLAVDHDALEVTLHGQPVPLTPTELRLLLKLVENAGIVVTRDTLLTDVWDYPAGGDTRVVDVHVQRLRGKIGKARIETVRGFGFKLVS